MQIDDCFYFGKYKGLTIRQVYQGTQDIDNKLLKSFVEYKINKIIKSNRKAEFITEVSNTLIRIRNTFLNTVDFDLTEYLNEFFLERMENRYLDNLSLDAFNSQTANQGGYTLKVTSGQPEYIAWCINTVDSFYIDPEDVDSLQSLTIFRYSGMKILRKIEDIYEYHPKIKESKFHFIDLLREKNDTKYFRDTDEDYGYYDPRDDYEYSCACGESPCMCSDPDPG